MIIYNTTFCVDNTVLDAFVNFLKTHYIPVAESTGIHSALILSIRGGQDSENNTSTIALQMRAPSESALMQFRDNHLHDIYSRISREWGTGVAFFESTLDIVHDAGKSDKQ